MVGWLEQVFEGLACLGVLEVFRIGVEIWIGVGLEVQVRVLGVWKGFRWGLDWFGSIFKKF